ncbi:hypothetical protein GCM10011344_27550 [Dokdonia pacifica]|uniref:Lipoprotein n=1 Tax=Dokdonia pacifica TaxID=1627892 RepID=A0A239CEW3_9FLAO|nr:hypothetical protein [Dokdonia pacifica]GGG25356.1 hypothetical protein GCM10011344_27550 [Dokdonia pacifica]SNS18650.1 hypothetical protein SAMN06265376_107290 [Dokdonia pacifica]
MEKIKNRILILSLIIGFFSCETEEINSYEEQQKTYNIRSESDYLSNTEGNDYEGFSVCKTCSEGYSINEFSSDTHNPKRTGDQADDHGNPEDGDNKVLLICKVCNQSLDSEGNYSNTPNPKRTGDQADDYGNPEDGDGKESLVCIICNQIYDYKNSYNHKFCAK